MKRKRGVSLQAKQQRYGYLFCLPVIIGFVFIFLPNLFMTVEFSLNDVQINGTEGYTLVWKGLKYFKEALFVDARFIPEVVASYQKLFVDVPVILIFSLLISCMINQKFKGRAAARAIFFIPVFLTAGVLGIMDGDLIGNVNSSGVATGTALDGALAFDMTALLTKINFNDTLIGIVEAAVTNIYSILISSGMQIYIFLAGIQEIPEYMYEAAAIEGCSKWESFWKITIPMLVPQIIVNLVYTIVIVGEESEVLKYTAGITGFSNYGLVTAMCVIYLATLAIFLGLIFFVIGRLNKASASGRIGGKHV